MYGFAHLQVQKTKGLIRGGTVVYCPTPRHKIWADSAYWDTESRDGFKYTIAAWDDCTGYLAAVHLSVRNEAAVKLVAWIDGIRADPKLNCPQFCKMFYKCYM
jgi:hypothetical protein